MFDQEIDFDSILNRYRSDPFDYAKICTPHTGVVRFRVEKGQPVQGPGGKFKHLPGTVLYELEREKNHKKIYALAPGEVDKINAELDGSFVEAGVDIMTIKHPLKKKEIIEYILRKVLSPYKAPENAKYFFSLEMQGKMEKYGQRGVPIKEGDEILTMSLMKRDTPVYYQGEPGIIHSVYFKPGVSVEQGEPLFGVCPGDRLPFIEKIITRVKAEWE